MKPTPAQLLPKYRAVRDRYAREGNPRLATQERLIKRLEERASAETTERQPKKQRPKEGLSYE
jgi:hypothetical protein